MEHVITWFGSMLATLSSVVAQIVDGYASINKKVTPAILVLQTIGFAGYQTNIFQFGIDQFPDALMPSNLLSVSLFGLTSQVVLQGITFINI